jgi:hypothetical protein
MSVVPVLLTIVTTLLVAVPRPHLAAQTPVQDPTAAAEQPDARDQARRVLAPDVFDQVDAEARALAESGIPSDILFRKALEGAAKRVPADRLVPGVLGYAGRLREARAALLPDPPGRSIVDAPLLVAGADALQRGVSPGLLRQLGEDGAERTPVSMLVLADLVETGIGDDRALSLVREAMRTRTRDQRMLDLPAQVRRLLRDGRTPSDVTDELRRALRRRAGNDRGGTG